MRGIEERFYNIGQLDALSRRNSAVHRLDPRTKIFLTIGFILAVTSHPRYAITQLLPFAVFPIFLASAADLPTGYIMGRLLIASPFAVLVGVFNPVIDREILVAIGGIGISGGWISFASIILRYLLCMSAALILIATTGFYKICGSLRVMKVPAVLTIQFMLLYRYLYLLTEEAIRLIRARRLRSFGKRRHGMKSTSALIASLLSRTIRRANRIHEAMSARGLHFSRIVYEFTQFGRTDILLLSAAVPLFILLRIFDVSRIIGSLILGGGV